MKYNNFASINWVEDTELENKARLAKLSRFRGTGWQDFAQWALSAAQAWIILALSGIVIGVIAVVLSVLTNVLVDYREGYCSNGFYLSRDFCCFGEHADCDAWHPWATSTLGSYIVYIFLSVLFALAASFMVLEIAPYAAGSGISELKCIIAGFIMRGFLGFRTLALKALSLPLTIASGFSVGKEGPSVHYAACVGNVIGRLFSKYNSHNSVRSEILTACSAAGVAVAFGSPIGGALFSVEEMSTSFSLTTLWRTYFCCMVATIVVSLLNPFRTGQLVLFSVKHNRIWHFFELPFFLVVGLFGGIMGHFIIKWNLRVQAWRKAYIKDYPLSEVALIALVTAVVCFPNQFLAVDMTKSIGILFHECDAGWNHPSCNIENTASLVLSLFTAFVLRTALVLVSYGAKVPAGIFVPSMAIGALFGRLVGTLVWALQLKFKDAAIFSVCVPDEPCIDPGTYALLGAGAFLSGVMHISISVVIILFELAGAVVNIIPSMIAVGFTTLVTSLLGDKDGIADRAIVANSYPFFTEEAELDGSISEVASAPVSLVVGASIQELHHLQYPIVDEDSKLVGSIKASELEHDLPIASLDLSRYTINKSPITVLNTSSLEWAHTLFLRLGTNAIFVVDSAGVLVGIVTGKDLVRSYKHADECSSQLEQRLGEYCQRKLAQLNQAI